MSDEGKTCPSCGAELPPDGISALCPKCLLQLGFDSEPHAGDSTIPYQPVFLAPPPQQLAPYFPELEILEMIGHGGMGVVYRARQKDLDRLVALKILRPDIEKDPSFAGRFQREARTLAQLDHPNIVTVHNFGRKDDLYFLIMEFVDGTNLRQLERTARLQPSEALTIIPRICEALQYAHQQGVVHRDIKPENILITQDGRVKIADFGLAKLSGLSDQFKLTGTWQVMGTPHYMAPEQFEHPSDVDHRADIFSLGVVIYEMLTGELPLGRFPLPSEKSTSDRRLDDIVQRALDKEPERRYQQASDVQTDVESISSSPQVHDSAKGTERQTFWGYFSKMLSGLHRWGDAQTSLNEPSLGGEPGSHWRAVDQDRLDQTSRSLFLGAKIALASALLLGLFPWPPVVRLSCLFGVIYAPVLLVLGHLIRSRQNLHLARTLTVGASIPLTPIVLSNLFFLFLKGRTALLWRVGIESEFADVSWKETDAAREMHSLWGRTLSFLSRQWSRVTAWSIWGGKTLIRQLRFLLALAIGFVLWSVMWLGTLYLVNELVFDHRPSVAIPDRVTNNDGPIPLNGRSSLPGRVVMKPHFDEIVVGTEVCLWGAGALLLTGLIGYTWFSLRRSVSHEKRQRSLARQRVLCSRGLIGCAIAGLLFFLLWDWFAFRSGALEHVLLQRNQFDAKVYLSVWGIILLCIGIILSAGILIRTGRGRWRRKIGLWGSAIASLAYPGNLLMFPVAFWSFWFLSTAEVRELFSGQLPKPSSAETVSEDVAPEPASRSTRDGLD